MGADAAKFIHEALVQYVWPVLGVVVTFAIAVLLHEFGHFIAARLSGVGVDVFSVGFGKRLWGIRRGITDYQLSALPLGGYVKLRGVFPKETERYLHGDETETGDKPGDLPACTAPAEAKPPKSAPPTTTGLAFARDMIEDAAALRNKPWLIRVFVFSAGCGFNYLVAAAVLAIMAIRGFHIDLPYQSFVGPVKEGSPLYEAGLRRGDRIIRFDGLPVSRWEQAREEQSQGILDVLAGLVEDRDTSRPIPCVVARTEAGKPTTFSLTLPPAGEIVRAWKREEFDPLIKPACIGGVVPFSRAEKAGIKEGDVVVAIDDRPIEDFHQVREIVLASVGAALRFQVKRGDEVVETIVTPDEHSTTPTLGEIGVYPGSPERQLFRLGLLAAAPYGFKRAADLTARVAVETARVFKRLRYREMKKSMAGPLGIFGLTFKRAREGLDPFLFNIAFLNIALMILNILPIPVLDGGHILITTFESVAGRPVPVRVLAGMLYFFLTLLICLVVLVTWFDLLRFADIFGLSRLIPGSG